ncbi:MAG: DUF4330 domain-containing protein [Clostridia bacterium]|nr:DUF4330 domain-containing protein [Clostridia bacterium]
MILDSKKRVFGIINLLDLILVLMIAVFIIGGMTRINKFESVAVMDLEKMDITLTAEDVSEGLISEIREGDTLVFSVKGSNFGVVKSVEKLPHMELVTLEDGRQQYTELPGMYDVKLVVTSDVKVDESGVMVSGNQVYIGQENRLKSRLYVFDTMIDSFDME